MPPGFYRFFGDYRKRSYFRFWFYVLILDYFAGHRIPPLCGAISPEPNYIGKAGDKVAARVKGQDGEENWILAEIVQHLASSNKYEVDDIDAEEGKEWVQYSTCHIIRSL